MSRQPYREVTAASVRVDALPGIDRQTRISVLGLDAGGTLAVSCLAHLGFSIIGVDINAERVRDLLAGSSGTADPRLETLLWDGVCKGRVEATQNLVAAVLGSDVTLLSTHECGPGSMHDTAHLREAAGAIGQALAMKPGFHVVVLRGEVAPGTMLGILKPALERMSGKRAGIDFGLCLMPELGRTARSVSQFFSPARTVIGSTDERSGAIVAAIFEQIDDKLIRTSVETAEMAIHAQRRLQAARLAFTTEIAQLTAAMGGNSAHVIDILGLGGRVGPQHGQPGPAIAAGRPVMASDEAAGAIRFAPRRSRADSHDDCPRA